MAGTDQLSAVFSALADPTRRAIIAERAADRHAHRP
jgi:DNA-binding transcriptional ArsR family regulator